jgi:hypothetical protein
MKRVYSYQETGTLIVLDAFDVNDLSEIWEVLTEEGGKQRAAR